MDLREILNAIFDRIDNGVKWRNLPSDFPAWQTVYGYFRLWVRLEVWEAIKKKLLNTHLQTLSHALIDVLDAIAQAIKDFI